MLLVLDLGLGERRLEGDGPVDRLLAAVDEALLDERGEDPQDVGLEGRRLGLVLARPVREHPEALELARLLGDPGLGKGVAEPPQLGRRDLPLRLAQLARDLLLDREAVAVPSGDVGRAEPPHGPVADGYVLEDLVHGGADVDVAVGEGRAVVQHEGRARRSASSGSRRRGRSSPSGRRARARAAPAPRASGNPSWAAATCL